MLLIYTPKITNRLNYIFKFVFGDVLGTPFQLTDKIDFFEQSALPRLEYNCASTTSALFLQQNKLIIESGIKDQNIRVSDWDDLKIFFPATDKKSILPFDLFAASFYLISRYEEYLPHIRDSHDRFEAVSSLAFNSNFITQALVDRWILEFQSILIMHFENLHFKTRKYQYINTIDVDNAYAFKQKGLIRTIGGYLRAIKNGNVNNFMQRSRVLLGKEVDPYDTYAFQIDMIKKYHLKSKYFFLLGDYGPNDKNIPSNNIDFQHLIKHVSDYAQVGIHPSYGSNTKKDQTKREVTRLTTILHTETRISRQHFLKLKFPDTYRELLECGITEDYTMGYATHVGFRASTCTPFTWYDLDMESETALTIYPFPIMEATLKFYMKVKPEDAMRICEPIINEVKSLNGTLITLWHNETLSNEGVWKDWKAVYEEMVAVCIA